MLENVPKKCHVRSSEKILTWFFWGGTSTVWTISAYCPFGAKNWTLLLLFFCSFTWKLYVFPWKGKGIHAKRWTFSKVPSSIRSLRHQLFLNSRLWRKISKDLGSLLFHFTVVTLFVCTTVKLHRKNIRLTAKARKKSKSKSYIFFPSLFLSSQNINVYKASKYISYNFSSFILTTKYTLDSKSICRTKMTCVD